MAAPPVPLFPRFPGRSSAAQAAALNEIWTYLAGIGQVIVSSQQMLYLDSCSHIVLTRERFNERGSSSSRSHGGVTGGFDCSREEGELGRHPPSLRNGRIIRDPLSKCQSVLLAFPALSHARYQSSNSSFSTLPMQCLPHVRASQPNSR